MPANKTTLDGLRNKLKLANLNAIRTFKLSYPSADSLLKANGLDLTRLRESSSKVVTSGLLAGAIITGPQIEPHLITPKELIAHAKENLSIDADEDKSEKNNPSKEDNHKILQDVLKNFLPQDVRPLARNEEKYLEVVISDLSGVPVKASIEGEHLNTTYGRIGAEQHLKRFPGDRLELHGTGDDIKEGMAPGLGAWGYFAPSQEELTSHLVEIEKWYAVVQTLYLPDWNTRQPYLKNWYKYRKVMIINTQNARAVVASIADSGPAAWTGKHFGGSPEVMNYLGGQKYKKGPVLVFFVDDPENKIPLGPVF